MNTNQPAGQQQDAGAELHLGKFAPGAAPAPPAGADEGQTLFFRRVATEVAQTGGSPVVAPQSAGALPAKEMLGAVAYCYAKGVYSSTEIEQQMLHDPALRQATHDELPDANAIRRFRRLNREAIQKTLEKWYRKLRGAKPTTEVMPGAQPPAPAPAVAAPKTPMTDDGNTSVMVRAQATDRLDKAAFIDNMEKE